jgi:radical SAM-linked protein
VASEAEYLELGLAEASDPDEVRAALDAALPPGLDIVEVVEAAGKGLADHVEASQWRVELPGVTAGELGAAIGRFLVLDSAPVERVVKDGRRTVDARAAVVGIRLTSANADPAPSGAADPTSSVADSHSAASGGDCAILDMVVRHTTPAVRPDDVLTALRQAAALSTPVTPMVTRLAQGLLGESLPAPEELPTLTDPLTPDAIAAPPPASAAQSALGLPPG